MKTKLFLTVAAAVLATFISVQAEELDRKKIARSIPEEAMICIRMDLKSARKSGEAKAILDAAEKKYNEHIGKIAEFSGLELCDVDNIWICVVKDKEAIIVLDGEFDTDGILNSKVVANSFKLARPGTLVTIEMKDEQKNELNEGTMISENLVAFGKPDLVEKFISNYVGSKSGWDKDGTALLDGLAGSSSMFNISVMHLPEKEISEKPFLANLVNARLEMNVAGKKVSAVADVILKDEEKAKAFKELINSLIVLDITNEIKVGQPQIKKAVIDGLKLGCEGRKTTLSSAMDIAFLHNFLRNKGLELE